MTPPRHPILQGRALILDNMSRTLEGFEAFAAEAARLGATHLVVSHLPMSRWQMRDPADPYPSWAMKNASLFKLVVPEALAPWLPADLAARNLDLVRRRCEVLRRHGLRGVFFGGEPMWLPEEVYRAHPDWRGPHCELTVIARHNYFSPCIDRPEVLALYRQATAALLRAAPEIDQFQFLTNDSGAGVCWSLGLYPGMNGPDWCRRRPMGQRLRGFFDAIQQGARDAGAEVTVQMGAFTEQEQAAVLPVLGPGQGINWRDGQGRPWAAGSGCGGWFSSHLFPVRGIPQPGRFARELEEAFRSAAPRISVGFLTSVQPLLMEVLREFLAQPCPGPRTRLEMLHRVAARHVGDEQAEALLRVWEHIDRAVEDIRHCRARGFASLLLVGTSTQRWLVRPLVPVPAELKPHEKEYWRRYQFAAKSEEEALDLGNVLGRPGLVGRSATWIARWALEDAIGEIGQALGILDDLAASLPDERRSEIALLARRLRVLVCVLRNAQHVIRYTDALYHADRREAIGHLADFDGFLRYDARAIHMRRLARAEIDNTVELIGLLGSDPATVLELAQPPEVQDVFYFGDDIVAQLRRKIDIMMDHWEDYERLYPAESWTTNPEARE